MSQGRPQAGLSAYRQAVALDPTETEYYLRTAELWGNQGDIESEERLLKAGVAKANQPAPVYAALADMYIQQGNSGEAKDTIEAGMAELGEDTALVIAMGLYLDSQVQQSGAAQEGAERWYNEHLSRNQHDAAIHRALADHFLRVERVDEALAHYERAVALEPANASLLIAAGSGYESAERMEDAENAFKTAALLEPVEAEGYLALSDLYRQQERWDEARAVYERAMAALPAEGSIVVAFADYWIERGDIDQALHYLDEAARIAPSTATLVARAEVYHRLQRTEEAIADLETALAKEPGLLSAMLALGDLHRGLGDTRSAQRAFVNASQMRPGVPAGRVRVITSGNR